MNHAILEKNFDKKWKRNFYVKQFSIFTAMFLVIISSVFITNKYYDTNYNRAISILSESLNNDNNLSLNLNQIHQNIKIIKDPIKKTITIDINKNQDISTFENNFLFNYIIKNKNSIKTVSINDKNISIDNILNLPQKNSKIDLHSTATSTNTGKDKILTEESEIYKNININKDNVFVISYK